MFFNATYQNIAHICFKEAYKAVHEQRPVTWIEFDSRGNLYRENGKGTIIKVPKRK